MIDGDAASRYSIDTKVSPTISFVGVTTGKSSIMKVFPRWMAALGTPGVVMEGIDHRLHDAPEAYRNTVAQFKYDPLSLGALITSHKIDVLESAEDMFDYLDPHAKLTGEVSCISKRDGLLEGHAKDPITAGLSLDHILKDNYFTNTSGQVMIIGAGGSGMAISLHFINKEAKGDRPGRIVVVNRSQPRLDKLRRMVDNVTTDIEFEYILNDDPRRNDSIMMALPDGSVVINATGMGKDRPGSPITNDGQFPRNSIAWEINYRGKLDFWHQAMAQRESREIRVEDGWLYFLYGWTEHIAQVLHIEIDEETFVELAELASELRPQLKFRHEGKTY